MKTSIQNGSVGFPLRALAAACLLASFAAIGHAQPFQTLGRNISVRSGSVFGPGETDYVIASATGPGQPGRIQIFRPSSSSPVQIFPPTPNNNLNVIDVLDLDGDGNDEIIALSGQQRTEGHQRWRLLYL